MERRQVFARPGEAERDGARLRAGACQDSLKVLGKSRWVDTDRGDMDARPGPDHAAHDVLGKATIAIVDHERRSYGDRLQRRTGGGRGGASVAQRDVEVAVEGQPGGDF